MHMDGSFHFALSTFHYSVITLQNVSKAYGDTDVLRDITLQINPGELVCVTGKSGAGKSTLLHLLTGAETVTRGSITVDGVDLRNVPPAALQIYRRRLGMVFQDYKLIPYRTVAENIAFPLEVCGVADGAIDARVNDILHDLDIVHLHRSLPQHLSGGEKARTAIGRAIAHKPLILLADEPTGNLDAEAAAQVLRIFESIHRSGTTVIIATHDERIVDSVHARRVHIESGSVTADAPAVPGQEGESAREPPESTKKKIKVTAINS